MDKSRLTPQDVDNIISGIIKMTEEIQHAGGVEIDGTVPVSNNELWCDIQLEFKKEKIYQADIYPFKSRSKLCIYAGEIETPETSWLIKLKEDLPRYTRYISLAEKQPDGRIYRLTALVDKKPSLNVVIKWDKDDVLKEITINP